MDIPRACLGPFHRRFCVSLGRAIVVSHNISNKTYVIQAKNIINDINFDLGQNTATGKVNFNQIRERNLGICGKGLFKEKFVKFKSNQK